MSREVFRVVSELHQNISIYGKEGHPRMTSYKVRLRILTSKNAVKFQAMPCNLQSTISYVFEAQDHESVPVTMAGEGWVGERLGTVQRRAARRPLSCQRCRQRKVACDKVLPCQPCQYSGLTCAFPTGRKQTSKTGNGELLRRIARLEQFILHNGIDGKESTALQSPALQDSESLTSNPSQQSRSATRRNMISSDSQNEISQTSERFIGHSFLKGLATEASIRTDWNIGVH